MRIAAMVNPDATGLLTENGEVVGAITANGTLALLFFGGLASGLVAGVVWVVASPWLPARGGRRLAAAAIAGVALGGPFLVRSGNRDFAILGSDALILALFLCLAASVALTLAWLDAILLRRLPRAVPLGAGIRALVAYAVIAFAGAVLVLPFTLSAYFSAEVCTCLAPRSPLGIALVVVGLVTLVSWARFIRGGAEAQPRALTALGRVAVLTAATIGTVRVVTELTRILGTA